MDIKTDKNKEREIKAQIKTLEKEAKSAYKSGQFESALAVAKSLLNLDPGNHLAEKLNKKIGILKAKAEIKAKKAKGKEYEDMLRNLLKSGDRSQLKALAAEFVKFDPENRSAAKWVERAEKLADQKSASSTSASAPAPSVKPVPITISKPIAAQPQVASGNIFTKMFGKKEEEPQNKSIIETIVAKSEIKDTKKKEEALKTAGADKAAKPKDATALLAFSKVFMNFCAIFIVLSAFFLYAEWIDKNNTVLGMVGFSENTGGKLYRVAQELGTLKEKEAALDKEIDLYKGGYDDKTFKTVQNIIEQRVNWPDVFAKINEVTNSVYELNDFFKYIEYNNYSFDAENGTIRVTGTLSDPLGRNLTKLVELEEAFKYYPKDKNDPEDTTKPYFTGFREFTSFSKSLDTTTGRYTSTFQMSFVLNK